MRVAVLELGIQYGGVPLGTLSGPNNENLALLKNMLMTAQYLKYATKPEYNITALWSNNNEMRINTSKTKEMVVLVKIEHTLNIWCILR